MVTAVAIDSAPRNNALQQFVARGLHWPLLIAALLLIPVVAGGYLAYQATHDPTFAIEADYYRKAVAWDATMAQAEANAKLAWQTTVTTAPAGQALEIVVQLRDPAGANLPDAKLHLDAFFLARSLDVQSSAAQVGPDGRYHATLKLPHAGVHELHLRAERGADVFTSVQRLDVIR